MHLLIVTTRLKTLQQPLSGAHGEGVGKPQPSA